MYNTVMTYVHPILTPFVRGIKLLINYYLSYYDIPSENTEQSEASQSEASYSEASQSETSYSEAS